MKTGSVICGIVLTSAAVCTGAVFSGVNARLKQEKKKQAVLKNYNANLDFSGKFSQLQKVNQDKFVSFQKNNTLSKTTGALTGKNCKINILTGIK